MTVVVVEYCGECSMPFEYCEYAPNSDKCKKWMEKNLPDMFAKDGEGKEGKRQTRGGKASKAKKKGGAGGGVEPQVKLASSSRGKRTTTLVFGLSTCGVKVKDAAKFFASKFAAVASVTGDDEILIQGDVKD